MYSQTGQNSIEIESVARILGYPSQSAFSAALRSDALSEVLSSADNPTHVDIEKLASMLARYRCQSNGSEAGG